MQIMSKDFQTLKSRLLSAMIEQGNDFSYSEMVALLLKIKRGNDHVYNYKIHRGYWSGNFSPDGGFMRYGGSGYVYKDVNKRWHAVFYANDTDRLKHAAKFAENKIMWYLESVSLESLRWYATHRTPTDQHSINYIYRTLQEMSKRIVTCTKRILKNS